MSLCFCGNKENMKHIYECKYWNTEEPSEIYEKVYTGTMNQQIEVLRRFEMNFEKREQYINSIESDQKNCETHYRGEGLLFLATFLQVYNKSIESL